MIYLLTEQAMNGTVTMGMSSTGIEAASFDEAFEKLTHFKNWNKAMNIMKDDERVDYTIPGEGGGFGCVGSMENMPLTVV